jgi:hypothetical protein
MKCHRYRHNRSGKEHTAAHPTQLLYLLYFCGILDAGSAYCGGCDVYCYCFGEGLGRYSQAHPR